jgi:hypothetical protein
MKKSHRRDEMETSNGSQKQGRNHGQVPVAQDQIVQTAVSGHTFSLSTRYDLSDKKTTKILGKGSYGVVVCAYDICLHTHIAVKRIRPYAQDEWDAKHTLREIRLMKLLGDHPNVISLYNLAIYEPKQELYMFLEVRCLSSRPNILVLTILNLADGL